MTEAVQHYGESIKAIMNEELGDGIMSAIDMYATVRLDSAHLDVHVLVGPGCYGHPVKQGFVQRQHVLHIISMCCQLILMIRLAACWHLHQGCRGMSICHVGRETTSCDVQGRADHITCWFFQIDVIKGKTGENRLVITLNGKVSSPII